MSIEPLKASGSKVTEIARGKKIIETLRIDENDVPSALGGLFEESQHCAPLAANTLKAVLRGYISIKRKPCKKAYHK
jgi:nitrogen fixation NifU-like protein